MSTTPPPNADQMRRKSIAAAEQRAIEKVAEYLADSLSEDPEKTFLQIAETAISIYLDEQRLGLRNLNRRLETIEAALSALKDLDEAVDERVHKTLLDLLEDPA